MGSSTQSWLDDASWILRLLPVDVEELAVATIDPSALETYTSTRVPLEVFQGVRLPRDLGDTLVLGRTTRRISTPIAAVYGVGFGKMTVIAADLDKVAI